MHEFMAQLVNGLTVGSVYALIALGYTMVYGVLRLINFAFGDLFTLGAYLAFTGLVTLGIINWFPVAWMALVIAVIGAGLLVGLGGVIVERVAYRPLYSVGRLPAVVSALGVSVIIENAIMLIWGSDYKAFPDNLVPNTAWQIAGVRVTLVDALIVALSVIIMLSLYFFIQRTRIGTAIRAIAHDHDTARLMGINVYRTITLVFAIGSALGATAGVFVGIKYGQLGFLMGWSYGLKAFTAAILGGIGNIPGAMIGGLLLGVVEALAAAYIASGWKNAIAFLILILILIIRPQGILGERVAEKI